jgi:RsiW-degrading membrane proteinase PrsW (M82 family)
MLVGLILGILVVSPIVLVYVLFIRWCDRFEPEPWYLVGAAFVWGALFATFGGGMGSGYTQSFIAGLLRVSESSQGMDVFGAVVLAPIFEEGCKGIGVAMLAVLSAMRLKEMDGALDGAIYGGIVGLGFTLTEDILYVSEAYAKHGAGDFLNLVLMRTVFLGLSHCTFTACTGLGFGLAVEAKGLKKKLLYPCVGFAAAMCMHAIHNGLPARFGDAGLVLMIVFSWTVDVLFFVLLWMLVARDRRIVIRELLSEVGKTIHPDELRLVSSYFALSRKNWSVLRSRGWKAFRERRGKQLAFVELAFVKHRRRRGESGKDLDLREHGLRAAIDIYTRDGVFVGR